MGFLLDNASDWLPLQVLMLASLGLTSIVLGYRRIIVFLVAHKRVAWSVLVGASLLAMVACIITFLVHWIDPGTVSERNEFTRTMAGVLGGALVAFNIYLANKTLQNNVRNTNLLADNQRTQALGHLSERFFKASEQLGDDSMDLRIAGLYSLERLANDHEEYYHQVVEVICAFVRRRSRDMADKNPEISRENPNTPPDIESAMSILIRRKHKLGDGEQQPLDLRGAYLHRWDGRGGDFQGSDFSGARVTYGSWENANLTNANFYCASIQEQAFFSPIMIDADFMRADARSISVFLMGNIKRNPYDLIAIKTTSGTDPHVTINYSREGAWTPGLVPSRHYLDRSSW